MGQQESFEKTYHDYSPLLFAITYRMLGSASDAEDIVQECYLRYAQAPAKEIHSTKAKSIRFRKFVRCWGYPGLHSIAILRHQ